MLGSKKKSTSEHLFLVLQVVTLFSTWKDQIVPGRTMIGILGTFFRRVQKLVYSANIHSAMASEVQCRLLQKKSM